MLGVSPSITQLSEDFCEESRLWNYPDHGAAQLLVDENVAVPDILAVHLDQERFQRVADRVTHVAKIFMSSDFLIVSLT